MDDSFKQALMAQFISEGSGTNMEQLKASKILFDSIARYFNGTYSDMWMKQIDTPEKVKEWKAHLVGITSEEAALAVSLLCSEVNMRFPPGPLLFRSYCLKGRAKNNINKRSLRVVL